MKVLASAGVLTGIAAIATYIGKGNWDATIWAMIATGWTANYLASTD